MSEKKGNIYRICPCDPCDVERIQSWLEDMAAEGWILTEDGVFCGVFTFVRSTPQKARYRLDVVQKQKPRLFGNGNVLTEEEKEVYRAMGWEYLLQYGEFRIYRTVECDAPELNTESRTHAMTIGLLKKNQRKNWVSAVVMVLFWLLHTGNALRYSYLNTVHIGVVFTLCVYGILLYITIKPLFRVFRLKRYEKRLLAGDSLTHHCDWKKNALCNYCIKVLPVLLCCGIAFALLCALSREGTEFPLEEYPDKPPFATMADTFPDGVITEDNAWLDYGTARIWENFAATNIEWKESCNITTADGEKYFCILRLEYHETTAEWLARGLEEDYYVYDSTRYHHKRFEDLAVPELGVDSVRVYNSYGSFYVLMRQGNRVVHAVVLLDNHTDQNQWLLWAEAMAEMLR